jgi:hypothetical protein
LGHSRRIRDVGDASGLPPTAHVTVQRRESTKWAQMQTSRAPFQANLQLL